MQYTLQILKCFKMFINYEFSLYSVQLWMIWMVYRIIQLVIIVDTNIFFLNKTSLYLILFHHCFRFITELRGQRKHSLEGYFLFYFYPAAEWSMEIKFHYFIGVTGTENRYDKLTFTGQGSKFVYDFSHFFNHV